MVEEVPKRRLSYSKSILQALKDKISSSHYHPYISFYRPANMSQPGVDSNHIHNIAIVGATGNVGSPILKELLAKNRFKLTAISRAESKGTIPDGVARANVDYNDTNSIVEALKGQDVLIITLSVMATRDTQPKLIRAAADAGVSWVIPNDFGMYTTDEAQNDTVGPGKTEDRKLVESLGVSSWIGVTCGFWYEHSLSGPGFYGFDIAKREAVFFDDGTEPQNTSTWAQVGRAVASLLSLPISSDSTDDKTALSSYRNRMVYISSFTLTQRDMFESLKRVTHTTDADWTSSHVPAKERYNEAKERLMKTGERDAFGKMLYTRFFFPGENAGYFEKVHGLDNEALALPTEDLDEATKAAIELGERGYWKQYGL